MISLAHVIVLLVAGVAAGLIGSAGGITSLVSYPALLAIGIPPLPASVTNVVAVMGSFPGSALGSRPELRGQMPWLRKWAPVAALGGALGVALLLLTPDAVFDRLVPYLLLLTSLVLLFQPQLSRWHETHRRARAMTLAWGLFVMSIYCGYFGAGSGVMVLSLLLLTVSQDFPRANALKNMMIGVSTVVAAVGFLIFGPVRVAAAVPLGVGLLAGSILGPAVARKVPGNVLRLLAATFGIGLAVWFFVNPGA
ncbi:MAG: sulfite exporter TauE/SafE family protein [Acidimicrobiales bacterium]